MALIDYQQQYGLNVPGRSTIGNIDLDKRVPYFPEGLNAAGMSTLFDNEVAQPGLGEIGTGTYTKTEESATIPVDENGTPIRGPIKEGHQYWANIPTVLHGTQRGDDLQQAKDAQMNYMLTGKHLGKYDQGMDQAVDGAIMTHLRQANDARDLAVSPELAAEMQFAIERKPRPTFKELLQMKGER